MKAIKKGSVITLIGLYVLTIPFFNALNVTSYDNNQILGHFGESTTLFTYSSYIPVFAMLAFVPLGIKIGKQIPIRTLVLTACFFSILFNTACLYTTNIYWFTFWRSLVAIVSITGIFATLIPIILKYNPTFNMAIMYGVIQFIQKGSQHLYQYIGVQFSSLYDWTFSIYFLNINFMICIFLAWLFYKKDITPLKTNFQFDWRGWFILIFFLTLILFLCTEGQSRNWLSDPKINLAFAFMVILIGIYFIHVRFTDEPIIDPSVYKYKNVVFGSFLFFYIGIMNGTGIVITNFMSGILGFDTLYISHTHLPILIGLAIAIPLSTYLLYKKIYLATIWILGFACFGMFHI
ncbi:MAG: MFS transporter, partial [Flavobacterium sp.]